MTITVVPIVKLPELYAPVAEAAHPLPAGSYGVVVWAEGRPELAASPVGMSTVAAAELADAYRGMQGYRVFVVRRGRDCVTVHTPDMAHAGNLLGTTPAPVAAPMVTNAPTTQDAYWVTLINRVMHDDAAQADHDANILAAMRRVHQLDASVPGPTVWAVALRSPRDGAAYVDAFTALLFEGDPTAPAGKRHLVGRLYATHTA